MQFTTSEIIVLLFCAITLIVSVVTLITVLKKNNNNRTENELQRILLNQQSFAQSQNDRAIQLEQRLHSFSADNVQSLENIRRSVDEKLESIRRENLRQLDEMRQTVDEKLQKTLEEKMNKSFSLVNERLEQVYKGLGEMQTLAVGVGDLKKVLSNVKTRGILGEIQLGAILSEILTKEQYEENIATKKRLKKMLLSLQSNCLLTVPVQYICLLIPNFRAIHILLFVMRLKAVTSNALNRHKKHLFSV